MPDGGTTGTRGEDCGRGAEGRHPTRRPRSVRHRGGARSWALPDGEPGRWLMLARVAEHVEVPGAYRAHGAHQGHHPPLPWRMEDGLVHLRLDPPEAVHA